MKNLIALLLLVTQFSFAQEKNAVSWSASFKSLSATEGEIMISAKIEKGWHTYSQRPTDAGPVPTSFSFEPSPNYSLNGKTEESKM